MEKSKYSNRILTISLGIRLEGLRTKSKIVKNLKQMVVAALMETKKGAKVIEQMGHFVHIYSGVHKSRITRKGV